MKKNLPLLFLTFLSIPLVRAEECGLLNLASCIPQKMYDFFISLINAPISPLLGLVKSLLTDSIQVSTFSSLWAVMVYIISLFYGFLLLYSGFTFILSGYDAPKRENAKEWLRNIVVMIVLVQASYFIYSLVLDMNSLMTSGVMNLITEEFFKLTADNIVNIGLEFFFALGYVVILLITALILTIRYLIVVAGVAILPFGIFLFFIPPLKSYGQFILNFLGSCIFITFFDAIIFLFSSQLLTIPLFENVKILVMISAFGIANLLMLYVLFFSAFKAALNFTDKATGMIILATKYFVK